MSVLTPHKALNESMSSRLYPKTPLLAACTAIWRDEKVLLARRDAAPNAGTWAMPGGLVEVGETLEAAAIREVHEETALELKQVIFNRFFEIITKDDQHQVERHYVLAMFVAQCPNGAAIAGDDAAAVDWFAVETLQTLPLTANTLEFVMESRKMLPLLT